MKGIDQDLKKLIYVTDLSYSAKKKNKDNMFIKKVTKVTLFKKCQKKLYSFIILF